MSKNLDAAIRYRIINSCLKNKFRKFPTKAELKEACEDKIGSIVSERTIDKDIFEMRFNESLGYNAPIEFDRKTKGYYYTDPNFSIDAIPIGQADINVIEFAAEILGQYKNVSILNDFKGVVNKITDTIKVQRMLYNDPILKGLVQLDRIDNIPGSEHINDLIESIKTSQIITLTYKKFDTDNAKSYSFEPYMLKEFDGLWYITGQLSGSAEIRTFALDRIVSIEHTKEKFEINKAFDREVYYNSVYGVTHTNKTPELITIKTDRVSARFLNIRPIHKSQVLFKEEEGYVWFQYTLVLNQELETKLMSLGFGCEVESPLILKESIKNKLKKAIQNYE